MTKTHNFYIKYMEYSLINCWIFKSYDLYIIHIMSLKKNAVNHFKMKIGKFIKIIYIKNCLISKLLI